jgi:hypothetical protein
VELPPVLPAEGSVSSQLGDTVSVNSSIIVRIVDGDQMSALVPTHLSHNQIQLLWAPLKETIRKESPFAEPTTLSFEEILDQNRRTLFPSFSARQTSTHIIIVVNAIDGGRASVVICNTGEILLILDSTPTAKFLYLPFSQGFGASTADLILASASPENIVISIPKQKRTLWDCMLELT